MREALRCVMLFLCGAIVYLNAHSQSVVNDSQLLSGVFTFPYREYGSGVSFFDCNNDGLDDITFPLKNDSIIVFLSNGTGFIPYKFNYIFGEAKMPLWADFDNDGDYDLLVTVYEGQTRLLKNNGNFEFEDVTNEVGLSITNGYLTYGASWGDYNNDGWLDLYVCVYDFGNAVGNFLFKNNGGQNFSNVTSVTGATINSDYSFQSTIIDFDFDGDVDIHVANDRYPRDGFYVNQGNFFQNLYSFYGLDRNADSMSSSWADYDHDGDMDFYVSNTALMGNDFWEMNDEGYFIDVAEDKGVEVFRWCWGALWVDINNNSWEDLYVCNQANPDDVPTFFINNVGELTQNNIIENSSESDVVWSYAAAKGDFNNDGFYDIAVNTY
ncbi:MAG: VCBS repeat-containing protein, partial [Flavobacteriales bacterium]